MSKSQRGLSFVLGDSHSNENHILPINALQYDPTSSTLYTAGRDGAIKAWTPSDTPPATHPSGGAGSSPDFAQTARSPSASSFALPGSPGNPSAMATTAWPLIPDPPTPNASTGSFRFQTEDLDEQLLKLETSICSSRLLYNQSPASPRAYSVANSYNIHFDWVNDIALVNNNTGLVSASSDLSIKYIQLAPHANTSGGAATPSGLAAASGGGGHIGAATAAPATASPDVHKFQNVHTDYIKKLSYIPGHNQMVSGGLDGKIVLWDLNTLSPVSQFQNQSRSAATAASPAASAPSSSIYSLANNASNGLIGCGGPNNTINLFDLRIASSGGAGTSSASTNGASSARPSPFIKKLIGHQDNIRCLLMNDNFILSGSSDTTVKLWDIRNFKVLQSFEIHDEPVWSLASPHATFKNFYSGDKSGVVIKTDISCLSANRSADDSYFTVSSNADEKLGVSTIISRPSEPTPVIALCVESGAPGAVALGATVGAASEFSIFSSTTSSLERYRNPDTSNLSRYQYLRACAEYEANGNNAAVNELVADDGSLSGAGGVVVDDLNSGFYDLVSHLSMDTTNYDIQSSFSAVAAATGVAAGNTEEGIDTNEYSSMFLSINGGPSQEFVNTEPHAATAAGGSSPDSDPLVDSSPMEILLNPLPEDQITPIPYNRAPFNRFELTPKSIIAKRMFNNKRHMIVLYLNGDIKIWDLFICREVKTFPGAAPTPQTFAAGATTTGHRNSAASTEITSKFLQKRAKDMDDIFNKAQTNDTLNNWCEVEIKAGKLLVMIKESIFDNVKIYYDELIGSYPFLALEHADNVEGKRNSKVRVDFDDRFFLSRIFLNSIFHQYAIYEWEFDNQLRAELKTLKPSKKDRRRDRKGSGGSGSALGGSSFSGTTADDNSSFISFGNGGNNSGSGAAGAAATNGNDANSTTSGNGTSSALKRIKMFSRKSSKGAGTLPQLAQSQTLSSQSPQPSPQHSPQQLAQQSSLVHGSLPPSPQISAHASIADSNFSLTDNGNLPSDIAEFIHFNYEQYTQHENNPSFKYHDSIMKLLQINKQRYMEKYNTSSSKSKLVDSLLAIYSNDPKYESKNKPSTAIDESKLIYQVYRPLIYQQRLPSNLLIIISEHSPELGNLRDLCSFHLEDLQKLSHASTAAGAGAASSASHSTRELVNDLRMYLPRWIGQPILYDFFPSKEGPKIPFQLVEADYAALPPNKKIGGKSGKKIKKLPIGESAIKLSSHNMLRAGKILSYLTDKFESRTIEMKDHKPPTEWLILECKGEILPTNMTLQTIKTKIWKSSSDIILTFRRKYDDE